MLQLSTLRTASQPPRARHRARRPRVATVPPHLGPPPVGDGGSGCGPQLLRPCGRWCRRPALVRRAHRATRLPSPARAAPVVPIDGGAGTSPGLGSAGPTSWPNAAVSWIRPRADDGPCAGERQRSPGRPAWTSGGGTRAVSPGDGCWAGTGASRLPPPSSFELRGAPRRAPGARHHVSCPLSAARPDSDLGCRTRQKPPTFFGDPV